MRESTTYQAILEEGRQEGRQEGRIEGERHAFLRQATRKFGPPDAPTRARVEAESDLARLEALLDRVLYATSWDELLACLS